MHVEVSDDLGTKAIEKKKMEIAFNTWMIIFSFWVSIFFNLKA